jgi:solute carrier family 25 carnitine/acylcarnitine transporter 20/29
MQTDKRFAGQQFYNVLSTVYKEEGTRGLYKGLAVTLVRAAPAHALIFFSYEWTSTKLALY